MKTERKGSIILTNGEFKFLLGVNYWPRKLNIRMWRDWSEADIIEDVKLIKELGIRVVRFFIKNEDFADENASVYMDSLEKLDRFLRILEYYGIIGFASFLVGHMSGKNWRIPWSKPEELYTPPSIEKTCRFIETIVGKFKDYNSIGGWILSNEISLVKKAESREEALAFLRAFSKTVKSIDLNHVVSSGDLIDGYMQETPNVRDLVDYVGLHLYLYDSDIVRHGYTYSAMLELYSNDGDLPVILEEFGFSTYQFSEESQARFINEVLYSALAHGASGAFIWCFSDFPDESDPPYEWRPLELGFGLIRKNGSLKPATRVVKEFSRVLEEVEKMGLHREFNRFITASIVAPFYLFRDYEFVWYRNVVDFQSLIQPLIVAYILASSAGIQSSMIYELDIEKALKTRKFIIMPSVIVALSSTWRRLLNYVESGGVVYTSLLRGIGFLRALHEAPMHLWIEFFGVENILEAGSTGYRLHGLTTIEFVRDFGVFTSGDRLELWINEPVYTFLAKPIDAEVLAVDGRGNPVLFKTRRGSGVVYLSLIPIETVIARQEVVEWSRNHHRIYESIAIEEDIERPYTCENPEVEVVVYKGRESNILITINHGYEKQTIIHSPIPIKETRKIGGDIEVELAGRNKIKLNTPRKGAGIIEVRHY